MQCGGMAYGIREHGHRFHGHRRRVVRAGPCVRRHVLSEQNRRPERHDREPPDGQRSRGVKMLEWLTHTSYAEWVNMWGWPLALTIHAFGTATVVGLMFIIGLRLFGLFRTIPYSALTKLIPLIWIAVACQILSGLTLWMTKPAQYLADGMFEVKIAILVVAIIVMRQFHKTLRQEANAWEAKGTVSPRGLKLVSAACVLWAAVTIGGRLTAYLGSLYLG